MKSKRLVILLGIATLLLGISTCFLYVEVVLCKATIADREFTIVNYQKITGAIGSSGGVSVDTLLEVLASTYRISAVEYNAYDNTYYYAMFPKDTTIKTKKATNFIGLELILNDKKEFKTIGLYKP